jgi:diaminopimelate epimerase
MNMRFFKYHGLGNDYLVLDPQDCAEIPGKSWICTVCHRNYGLGSDGILYGPLPTENADFGLKIFNPDGSEAEKSGNGLRIFARYLFDQKRVGEDAFSVETPGGVVECVVRDGGQAITVEMGKVSIDAARIPVRGVEGEVLEQEIELNGKAYSYSAATIGNPHCVVPVEVLSEKLARELGPLLETHSFFPNRTNVQFLKVLDRNNIQIEIWERGAGYTLASGSSSSAAGAVARRLGLVDSEINVHMPGGQIQLRIDGDYAVTMTGPTTRVGEMHFDEEALTGGLKL